MVFSKITTENMKYLIFSIPYIQCIYLSDYTIEREHSGLRRIAGLGVTVTRGAASAMMFTYATLLLTMCRNTITYLRETPLHLYIPFDRAVDMHKFIAKWALFFTSKYISIGLI